MAVGWEKLRRERRDGQYDGRVSRQFQGAGRGDCRGVHALRGLFSGMSDGYAPAGFGLSLVPLTMMGLLGVMLVLPRVAKSAA